MKRHMLILGAGLIGLVMVLALVIAWGDTGGSQTARADGPTPEGPTPTPKGPENGKCNPKNDKTPTPYKKEYRQAWSCVPDTEDPFDRIQIHVGKDDQKPKLDPKNPPLFQCVDTTEQVVGEYKAHIKDANPTPTPLPNHEVWSGDFKRKCTGPVQVWVVPLDDTNSVQIKEVYFEWSGRGGITGNLTGIYDVVVLQGVGDLYHCISRNDHYVLTNEVKTTSVCYANIDISDPAGALPDLEGEGPPGDDGEPGPPPPPPYTAASPTKFNGFYDGSTLTVRGCFSNIGGTLGPNIVVTLDIPNAKDTVAVGSLLLNGNQTNAACESKTPNAEPGAMETTFTRVANQARDTDGDGCTDFQELDKTGIEKCGDDPYNPHDSGPKMNDISGAYSLTVTGLRADWDKSGDGQLIPGVYFNCLIDIQHDTGSNGITMRQFCYIDAPFIAVNPAAGTEGGDGLSGGAPPPPYAQVPTRHTEMTGHINKEANLLIFEGCVEDQTEEGSALGHAYFIATSDLHTGQGKADIYASIEDLADCTADRAIAAAQIPWLNAEIEVVRQMNKEDGERDTDGDGCSNKAELTDDERAGGLRDPFNKWDYFNPTNDGRNRIDDVLAVIANYRADDPPDTNKYDRTAVAGSSDWNTGPPNGTIRIADVLAAIFSYRHDCGEGDVWPAKPTPWE